MENIVYLHGFNSSPVAFNYLQSSLPLHFPHQISYNSWQSIQNSLKDISEKIPDVPVTIIGHSLGGILGYLIASRKLANVQKLITISTPFAGSLIAGTFSWFYPHQILKDISPYSKYIKEIRHPLDIEFYSLMSIDGNLPFTSSDKNDGTVSLMSQFMSPAKQHIKVHANHMDILQSNDTVHHIQGILGL
jgi:pimeloyl-ACP methyl ester carboxylesterase